MSEDLSVLMGDRVCGNGTLSLSDGVARLREDSEDIVGSEVLNLLDCTLACTLVCVLVCCALDGRLDCREEVRLWEREEASVLSLRRLCRRW